MEQATVAKTKQTNRLKDSAHYQAAKTSDAAGTDGTEGTGYRYQLSEERVAKVDREVALWKRGGRGEVPRDTLGLVDAARRLHKRMVGWCRLTLSPNPLDPKL